MKTKYCLPIIKKTEQEVMHMIYGSIGKYAYFEVWLDYIDQLDETFIEKLEELLKKRLILLFRRQKLEKMHMDLGKRLKIISRLNGRSFIDLDVFDQKQELDYIKNNKLRVRTIVSYHNYKETPSDEKLKEIIDTMQLYKPEIIKISTFCNSQKDALRLLHLLLELKERKKRCIVLGMGEFGNITRIFGTLWGNEMVFAPQVSKEQSAKGQLTRKQLERIFGELNFFNI